MEINKDEIEKIALLSRLKLSDKEKEMYRSQFSSILKFVDQLNDLNISSSEILGLKEGVENQLRDDKISECPEDEKQMALSQAFDSEDDQIKVKRVL
jgi:aspartyl-tRNA(Asn)/glutamyl-tRNA(Gln) amidotransferase subunit C